MIDWMFVCILLLALILFIIILFYEDEIQSQWLLGLVIFDIALWWALASGNLEIELPYEIYNATSGNVETGFHIFSSKTSPALMYLFGAPAIFMFIYMNYMIFHHVIEAYNKMFKR